MLQEKTQGQPDRARRARSSTTCSTSCGCASCRRSKARSASSSRSSHSRCEITFLGTGTSHGVPMIGCDCATCRRPIRATSGCGRRSSSRPPMAQAVLVDAGPTCARRRWRYGSAASTPSSSRTATPITSSASTRCGGSTRCSSAPMPCYGDARDARRHPQRRSTTSSIRRRREGGGLPQLELFRSPAPFCIGGRRSCRFRSCTATRPILGFRFGALRVPDRLQPRSPTSPGRCSRASTSLVLDALRERPHPTHFSLSRSDRRRRAASAPRRTFFTHMCHDLGTQATSARLPAGDRAGL